MPRNGSGTYSLPSGQPVVTGTVISSTTFNNLTSDLATALTQSLAVDGQAVPTANLPMGGFKLTNLGNGSASTDSINYGQVQGLISADRKSRNRIINGGFNVDQRNGGAAQTITAGAALAYTVDRWYAYCTGANVSGQRGGASGPGLNSYVFSGAASVTGIGIGQRIERADSFDLAGNTATLSVYMYNTLLTSVNWALYYANTNDTFGTLASPTRTLISSGTFTVTNSLARYTASVSIPAGATTGLELVLSVGAQTSGIWVLAGAQLEKASAVSEFEQRSAQQEFALCQRFFQSTRTSGGGGGVWITVPAITTARLSAGTVFPVQMRATPTLGIYSANLDTLGSVILYNGAANLGTAAAANVVTAAGFSNFISVTGTPFTAGNFYSHTYQADAEL